MKPVKLFYQERCPFCKKALRYIEELKAEYPEFQPIEIEMIEETGWESCIEAHYKSVEPGISISAERAGRRNLS